MKLHRRPKERHFGYALGRQTSKTTRLRFISRIVYWTIRSLLQEEEHCCQPSSAYINLFYRL